MLFRVLHYQRDVFRLPGRRPVAIDLILARLASSLAVYRGVRADVPSCRARELLKETDHDEESRSRSLCRRVDWPDGACTQPSRKPTSTRFTP